MQDLHERALAELEEDQYFLDGPVEACHQYVRGWVVWRPAFSARSVIRLRLSEPGATFEFFFRGSGGGGARALSFSLKSSS